MIEFKVNNCCGCIGLRGGTMILAFLTTTFSIIFVVFVIMQTAYVVDYLKSANAPKDLQELYPKITIPYTIVLLIVDACLLGGVIKSKREYMLPYIILNGSLLVTFTFLILVLMIAFPLILIALIIIAIEGYFWLVIYSYYLSLAPLPQQVMFQQEV